MFIHTETFSAIRNGNNVIYYLLIRIRVVVHGMVLPHSLIVINPAIAPAIRPPYSSTLGNVLGLLTDIKVPSDMWFVN
jgi:hypothetical protein